MSWELVGWIALILLYLEETVNDVTDADDVKIDYVETSIFLLVLIL